MKLLNVLMGLGDSGKSWHEKTVKTLINRLVKKQALGFEKEQRRYLYFPLVEKQEYQKVESRRFDESIIWREIVTIGCEFRQPEESGKRRCRAA